MPITLHPATADFCDEERAVMPPAQQLLVRALAKSGAKSLYPAARNAAGYRL